MNARKPAYRRDIQVDAFDLPAAREWMSAICGPHRLQAAQADAVRFRYRGSVLKGLSTILGRIEYGTEVSIDISDAERFDSYSLSLPLAGEQELVVDGRRVHSMPGRGVIVEPNRSQRLRMSGDCRKLQVIVPRWSMQRVLEDLLQGPLERPLAFDASMDANDGATAAWWRMIDYLDREMELSGLYAQGLFNRDLERALLKGLILAQPNNYSEALRRQPGRRIPHYLLRARDFIHVHAREVLCLEDLQRVAGVSRLKLFEGFRRYFGCAPMTYLKHYRLQGVREEILAGAGPRSISAIAMGWGFVHLGRFAGEYHKLFGELPSVTLSGLSRP
ncbi:helix-turn-helix domain-containing protein [Pseudomonas aeruginosa]|uniref:AraC family transcriptional regulator n=1 Tax=Pseudomonas aeruginosa TaxID=287 RepID=UPI0018C477C2|nr:helix-turn-helix domain-containing protein [Pseudomonas aeruginosa]MBG5303938.1 helix-turn-helix domain-containing protein [Pseudomonas aeruginosa]MDI3651189.1 helix-turn-helix domain-containing protein [Pseudomonas aeruginosa]MDI3798738.1 helix-turn-helix domain-containing protein [Pseudomonas aeruginosa]WRH79553.1 helix-turn-helix domain-containing protein [Pseudomonas aeruginosa]